MVRFKNRQNILILPRVNIAADDEDYKSAARRLSEPTDGL